MTSISRLPQGVEPYTNAEHLYGTMAEFGSYRLTYEPPHLAATEAEISMSISSQADLSEMLSFFESFLLAAGYQLDGKELSLKREKPDHGNLLDKFDWQQGVICAK